LFPNEAGGWIYQLNAIKFFNPGDEPDTDFLLRDLSLPVEAAVVEDTTYLDHILAVDVVIDFFKAVGLWDGVLHPWFDMFLPDSKIEQFAGETLANLTPEDVGPTGFMLIFGLRRSAFEQPLFRLRGTASSAGCSTSDAAPRSPIPSSGACWTEPHCSRRGVSGGTRHPIGRWFNPATGRQYADVVRTDAGSRLIPDGILSPGA
jgi:hypothetical protein